MRLLLVGPSAARERLRAELEHTSFSVAGEFTALAEARASEVEADAILISAPVGRALTARPTNDDGTDAAGTAFVEPLTRREIEVLELLAEGLPNKSIAARLGISDQTVKFHVASICGKLGATNRTQAVRLAVGRGLISL